MPWYVVRTKPNLERRAAREMREVGLRVYLPTRSYEVESRTKKREPVVRFRPLMIGYLFVRFPDALLDHAGLAPFGLVHTCKSVIGFLTAVDETGEYVPFPVREKDARGMIAGVRDIMRRQRRRDFGRPEVETSARKLEQQRKIFRPGRRVSVDYGALAGFVATLQQLNSKGTLAAEVELLGRKTRVALGVRQVTPLAEESEVA